MGAGMVATRLDHETSDRHSDVLRALALWKL